MNTETPANRPTGKLTRKVEIRSWAGLANVVKQAAEYDSRSFKAYLRSRLVRAAEHYAECGYRVRVTDFERRESWFKQGQPEDRLQVTLTPREFELIRQTAKEHMRPVSAWCRIAIWDAIEREGFDPKETAEGFVAGGLPGDDYDDDGLWIGGKNDDDDDGGGGS